MEVVVEVDTRKGLLARPSPIRSPGPQTRTRRETGLGKTSTPEPLEGAVEAASEPDLVDADFGAVNDDAAAGRILDRDSLEGFDSRLAFSP